MKVTKSDFKKAIEKEPSLTSGGIKSLFQIKNYKKLSLDESKKVFERDRELFSSEFEDFKICCEWLSKFKKIKTPQFSSYYLKNVVEKLSGEYVSNGALIAAAVHLNIPIRLSDNSPNANIAISKKCHYLKDVGPVA